MPLGPGREFKHFRIERKIGQGAFATVWQAFDSSLERRVALKVLTAADPEGDPAAHRRMRQEARVLARLKSPNVVTLHAAYETQEHGWVFVMEYVGGGSVQDVLKAKERPSPARTLNILHGIARGLKDAHDAGIVHGDVKPANVLLDAKGTAMLADFGLAKLIQEQSLVMSADGTLIGTPRYMAPEVWRNEPRTPSADVWSFGVIVYQFLAGRWPFDGRSVPALFQAILNVDPPPLDPSTPHELAHLVDQCLRKDPRQRSSGLEVALRTLDRFTLTTLPPPLVEAPPLPAAPPFFGRRKELGQLEQLLDRVLGGQGASAMVMGEAGVGKSALMQEVAAGARRRGFIWIETRVTPVEGLLRSLLGKLRWHVSIHDLERRFGPSAPFLKRALHAAAQAAEAPEQMVWAVERLLVSLAVDGPVCLVVEDAQLCDIEDVRLLRELIGRLIGHRVLVAVAYRTGDPDSSDVETLFRLRDLTTQPDVVLLPLDPLEEDDVYRLLQEQAEGRQVAAEIAREIIRKSEGNPLYALELYRHLLEVGEIRQDESRVNASPGWGKAELPQRLHDLVARRLEGLSAEDCELLDAAAVDGLDFDGEAVAAVVGRPLLSVLRSLQTLYRTRGLVSPLPSGYRFSHALFQEVLHSELAPELRRKIHRDLARHLETRATPVDPERLGLHWERAGDRERARPHLLRAARTAAGHQRFRRTIDLCRRAGVVPGRIDATTALDEADVLFSLAVALQDSGQRADAESVYAAVIQAAEEAGDERLRTRALVHDARLRYYVKGLTPERESDLRRAAEVLPPSRELGLARWMLGVLAKFRGDLQEAKRWLQSADEIYLDEGIDALHSSALDELGSVAARAGRLREAEALYADAARVSHSVGRRINAATSEVNQAIARYRRGVLEGLDEMLQRAIRTLALEGATDVAAHAKVILGEVRVSLGDTRGARAVLREALVSLRQTNYLPGLMTALLADGNLLAAAGGLDEAGNCLREAVEIAEVRGSLEGRALGALNEALRLCFAADFEAASERTEHAFALVSEHSQPQINGQAVMLAAESILHGLPPAEAQGADALLQDTAGDVQEVRTATAFLAGARCFAAGTASGPLHEAAQVMSTSNVTVNRALLRVVAGWFESEALRRDRSIDEARAAAKRALKGATKLGHVWVELGLLRLLATLEGDQESADRVRARVAEVAAGLRDAATRSRVERRWLV
ncbi:MAG: serine/threonine-protein kinase [Planctomycetota bacterium]